MDMISWGVAEPAAIFFLTFNPENEFTHCDLPALGSHLGVLHIRLKQQYTCVRNKQTTMSMRLFCRSRRRLHLHFILPKACSTMTLPQLILKLC